MTDKVHFPGEWAPHDCVWTAWPSDASLWEDNLAPARAEVAAMVRAIAAPDAKVQGETVKLLCRGNEVHASAMDSLKDLVVAAQVDLIEAPIGDIWLRDTGPIFVERDGAPLAARFRFNGWGGKYELPDDDKIAAIVADRAGVPSKTFEIVLEGGAIDGDGEGTILTTRQCLLNNNRNPGMSEADIEAVLRDALGVEKIIWLEEGLLNDHTDGHVDNIARFIAPGKIVCMRPFGDDDPNAAIYADIVSLLKNSTHTAGRRIEIIEIPSPGLVAGEDGAPVPASHVNFYIANRSVVMPVYAETDEQREAADKAEKILSAVIDRPHFFALSARHLLTGGGSFHCITQQQPFFGKE